MDFRSYLIPKLYPKLLQKIYYFYQSSGIDLSKNWFLNSYILMLIVQVNDFRKSLLFTIAEKNLTEISVVM